MDQEQWFERFLGTDPQWRLSADGLRLILFNDRVRIVFEDHPWPPPWSADGRG